MDKWVVAGIGLAGVCLGAWLTHRLTAKRGQQERLADVIDEIGSKLAEAQSWARHHLGPGEAKGHTRDDFSKCFAACQSFLDCVSQRRLYFEDTFADRLCALALDMKKSACGHMHLLPNDEGDCHIMI